MESVSQEQVSELMEDMVHDLEKQKMDDATEAHYKALEYSLQMSDQMMHHETIYEQNKNIDGPLYWQLYMKFRDAEADYIRAKELEKIAEEALNAAEAEYYANLKCTFCGSLDSICGGDHSEEMRYLGQPRYS